MFRTSLGPRYMCFSEFSPVCGETEASRSSGPHLPPRAPPAGGTHIWGQSNNICGAQLVPMSCGGRGPGWPLGLGGLGAQLLLPVAPPPDSGDGQPFQGRCTSRA